MFKVVNKCGPELIRDLFKLTEDSRSRSKRAFFRPNVNHEQYGKESIRYFGTIVWDDMLPEKYKSIKKLKKFKEEIRNGPPLTVRTPCVRSMWVELVTSLHSNSLQNLWYQSDCCNKYVPCYVVFGQVQEFLMLVVSKSKSHCCNILSWS